VCTLYHRAVTDRELGNLGASVYVLGGQATSISTATDRLDGKEVKVERCLVESAGVTDLSNTFLFETTARSHQKLEG